MLRDWLCILLGIHFTMGVWAFRALQFGWLAYCLIFVCTAFTLLSLQAEPHNKEDYHDDFYS